MNKHKRIFLGSIFLSFLFLLGCTAVIKNQKDAMPATRAVYAASINKTYNIPIEFPNPYDAEEMKEFLGDIYPLSPTMPMVLYYKIDEWGERIKDSPIYILIFDSLNELVGCNIFITLYNQKYWVYRDGKFPEPCADAHEQARWLKAHDETTRERASRKAI